jgi:hypothetical protein
MKKVSDFDEDLYNEMLEDDGVQYDPELREEIKDYYLYSE